MQVAADADVIARRIVGQFRASRRDLPWRRGRDPYAVWISEVMLQQTRVATVIPYYERWMARFPGVHALAEAPAGDVLAAWSGLGYYSRARNLHRAAKAVVSRFAGVLPSSADALRELPGIGRYTAGAIASIAFGQREPVVDGNVARVLARLYAVDHDIKSTAGTRALWRLAGELVPADAPGDFNQGIMELGATLCTPARPACLACPLAEMCQARAGGRQHELPITRARKPAAELPVIRTHALWITRRGRLLLARRAPYGLYGGLWELPQSEDPARLESLVPAEVRVQRWQPVAEHSQFLSHRRLVVRVVRADIRGRLRRSSAAGRSTDRSLDGAGSASPAADEPIAPGGTRYDAFAWQARETLTTLGLSSATRAVIDQLLGPDSR